MKMRTYVTRAELLDILNSELAEHDECVDCQFSGPIIKLQDPQDSGLNWSDELTLRCSGRSSEGCQEAAREVAARVAGEYSLCSDEGWLDDLVFSHEGRRFVCVSRSGGVASVSSEGPWARPSNAYWRVQVDGGGEINAFPAEPDDTDPEDLRGRILDWWEQQNQD